jgi:hypothetical protein
MAIVPCEVPLLSIIFTAWLADSKRRAMVSEQEVSVALFAGNRYAIVASHTSFQGDDTMLAHDMQSIPHLALASYLLLGTVSLVNAQSLRESRGYTTTKESKPAEPTAPLPGKEIPVGEALQRTITHLVVEQLPKEYENTKKWGGKKRVMSGLDWELDGLRVETRRQYREANHGSWSMYKLKLLDEDQFQVRLENLRDMGENTAECDLILLGKIGCLVRKAEWCSGVQLFSISAEGTAHVKLKAHAAVKMGFDPRTLPPDILLSPHITTAELVLDDLTLDRVGQADGAIIKQMSDVVEHGIDEYLTDYRDKLAEKMNQQIKKKEDKLRIPLSQFVDSPWGKWFGDFFGQKKKES